MSQIDITAVATALKYKNPVSVANRIHVLKKQFGIEVICSNSGGSPRKGAKTAQSRGPVKATAGASPMEDNLTTPTKKRGRKPKETKVLTDDEADIQKEDPKGDVKGGPKEESTEDNVKLETDET